MAAGRDVPIRRTLLREASRIRKAFRSPDPLPRLVVVPDFLRRAIARRVVDACITAEYARYCAFTDSPVSKRVHRGFCEPDEKHFYVTVHERPRLPIRALENLEDAFADPRTLAAVSSLTGIDVQAISRPAALTCWGRESFLQPHTDYEPARSIRLVLSLSLTRRWHSSYGGTTVYAWKGMPRAVRIQPRLNCAVLFVPFAGSVHWVEQVSAMAPPRRRFTWTVYFA